MKVRSRADLALLEAGGRVALRPPRPRIAVGMATCGLAAGAADVYAALRAEATARGLELDLVAAGCLGYCQQEPLVDVRLADGRRIVYARITARRAHDLVSALAEGRLPAEGALAVVPEDTFKTSEVSQTSEVSGLPLLHDLPFYAR